MRNYVGMKWRITLGVLLVVHILVVACGGKEGEHSHADDDHHDHHHEEEGHHHDPPHGGAMAQLGDHFAHLEVTLNSETGKLTLYILDGEAISGIPISAPHLEVEIIHREGEGEEFEPFVLMAEAIGNPLTGEQPGNTSEFEGRDERLSGLSKFRMRLQTDFELKGQKISGVEFDFPEGADDHGHDDD